jgi:hypothetical protein
MRGITLSVSALVLGLSSLAFTTPARADSGLTVIYSSHGYGYRSYPVKPYYHTHRHGGYGRACALPPRHKHGYGYGHRKQDLRHDRRAWRDHDRTFYKRDSRRTHTGYARINRY